MMHTAKLCDTGRMGFPSAHAAKRKHAAHRRGRLRVYWCSECHLWHATRDGERSSFDRARRRIFGE